MRPIVFMALLVVAACSTTIKNPNVDAKPPPQIPPSLAGVSGWSDVFIIGGVAVAAVGLTLFFLEPALAHLSIVLAGGGGCTAGCFLALKISLPYDKYIVLGSGIIGLAAVGYKLYLKYFKGSSNVSPKV